MYCVVMRSLLDSMSVRLMMVRISSSTASFVVKRATLPKTGTRAAGVVD